MTDRSKLLHRKMPKTWWLKKRAYTIFMLREFSAIFVALVAVGTILQVQAIRGGPDSYDQFAAILQSPAVTVFGIIGLAFALLHAITFFQATGKVFVIRIGENRVPEGLVAAAHYIAFLLVSVAISAIVLFWIAS